ALFFFSSRRRHTMFSRDWSSDVCSSDLEIIGGYRGQPLGGSLKTVGQVELVFPKLFDSNAARVSAFVDFGNVFNGVDEFDTGELRASAGVALLWRAPVGPISISYAYPFKKKEGDELERLQFTFGGGF